MVHLDLFLIFFSKSNPISLYEGNRSKKMDKDK